MSMTMNCFVMPGIGKVGMAEKGVDSAIEALGSAKTFAACVSVTRPGGTNSNVGYHGDGDSVPIPREAWGVGMSDKRTSRKHSR